MRPAAATAAAQYGVCGHVPDGQVAAGFGPVADSFAAVTDPSAPGCALAVVVDGVPVLGVWTGTRRPDGSPWGHHTPAVVFSGTKGLVATVALLLVQRGQLELSWPVARLWPEFATAGKQGVLVRDLLAHTAGLPGVAAPLQQSDLAHPERIAAALARQAPVTAIGAASYHALTFGWLLDAVVRRADGRALAQLFADDIAGPLGLDTWIGVPASVLTRVATVRRAPDYQLAAYAGNAHPDPRLALVYGNPPVADLDWGSEEMLRAEMPAANGVTTASSMARLYGCLARGGTTAEGIALLEPETIAAGVEELSCGPDPLTGRPLRFGAGFELAGTPSVLGPVPDAFGHTGSGGSSHGAWPALRTGFSLVVSELRAEAGDDRARRVLAALHAVIG